MRNVLGTLLMLTVMVSGCVNPINLHTAGKYFQAGHSNLSAGDWVTAQKNFGKAVLNAKLGKADDRAMAVYLYEYGRASGVLCDWTESEKSLIAAYELDRENDGPTHMSLVELTRMHIGRQEFSKAVEYFDKVLPELKNIQADAHDPIGYADFLEEYFLALEQTEKDEAIKIHRMRERAKKLRNTFPDAKPFHDKTPYGTQCQKN